MTDREMGELSENELNQFLEGVNFLGAEYSSVSGLNLSGKYFASGIVLVKYDKQKNTGRVAQMKQFSLASAGTKGSATHNPYAETLEDEINRLICTVDLLDIKYAAIQQIDPKKPDVTGLVLIIYRLKPKLRLVPE